MRVAGEIVEHHDRRAATRKVMLQRQHLPPVAQRALRKQPNLGQAVDDDPLGLVLLDRLENALGRFAELEVGRIEQALLLILVEQALRGDELVNPQRIVEFPTVGTCARTQLLLRLRQSDVQPALAQFGIRPRSA